LTIAATGGGGGGAVDSVNGQTGVVVLDSDDISEGATNLYFTTERAQDSVGASLSSSGEGVDLVYNDGANTITANLDLPNLGLISATDGVDLMLLYDNSATTHRVITVDDFIAGKGITDELVKVSATDTTAGYLKGKLKAGNGITHTQLNVSSDEDLEIATDPTIVFDKITDTTDDITEGATNLFFTTERAQDVVGSMVTDTTTVSWTYNDAGNDLSADVTAATDTDAGVIELATIAETNTGTATNRAVTPDALAGSYAGQKPWSGQILSDQTAWSTGDGKFYLRIPPSLNGMNLIACGYAVVTKSTSGLPTIQLARGRQASAGVAHTFADMLSTKLTIDANQYDSQYATTAAVIDTANDDVLTGDIIRFDFDVAGTGTKGCIPSLTFGLP